MKTGIVKFFNESKGFGFIIPDDGSRDVFVHSSKLGGLKIQQDDKVKFDTEQGQKGINAINVKKL